jgi:hypothetical protein
VFISSRIVCRNTASRSSLDAAGFALCSDSA